MFCVVLCCFLLFSVVLCCFVLFSEHSMLLLCVVLFCSLMFCVVSCSLSIQCCSSPLLFSVVNSVLFRVVLRCSALFSDHSTVVVHCCAVKLGDEGCSGSNEVCIDGMMCHQEQRTCYCKTGSMTPDRQHCLRKRHKLLNDVCLPSVDQCFQKTGAVVK